MNTFADSLADLRYERGLVSFRLTAGRSPAPGAHLFIPVEDFGEIVRLLNSELPKIESAHRSFLASQGGSTSEQEPAKEQLITQPPGKKIASV